MQGLLLVTARGVVEAEGRDGEQVGKREIICKKTQLVQNETWNQNSQVDFDNLELLAHSKLFPAAILSVNLTLSFFTIGLTFCRLVTRASAIFAKLWSQEDELHHVGLGDPLEDDDGCGRSEFCGSAQKLRSMTTSPFQVLL